MKFNKFTCLLLLGISFFTSASFAQVRIEVDGGVVRGKPIAIVPFNTVDGSGIGAQMNQVIADDLRASGKFEPLNPGRFLSFPSKQEDVRFKDWRLIDAEALVVGELWKTGEDLYELQFRIFDVAREQQVGQGTRIPNLRAKDVRTAAHIVSDFVYEAFMHKPGAYHSRIAFVRSTRMEGNRIRYRLMVADWDGYGEQEVFASWLPLLSPAWSPDGKTLAFVSFTESGSVVRVLDTSTGQHEVIAQFKGINSAPSWSPDGTKIAYSSSKTGSPDIYIYDRISKQHQRVTTHYGIDTEPSWTPDGRSLLFTSNRSRKPQIYQHNLRTNETTRLTFEGDENANAAYDYNGQRISLVHDGGQIAVLDDRTQVMTKITSAKFDESPSFSPNGDMVLYASEQAYRPALFVSSSDGRVRTRLEFLQGEVREPAWSPLRR